MPIPIQVFTIITVTVFIETLVNPMSEYTKKVERIIGTVVKNPIRRDLKRKTKTRKTLRTAIIILDICVFMRSVRIPSINKVGPAIW